MFGLISTGEEPTGTPVSSYFDHLYVDGERYWLAGDPIRSHLDARPGLPPLVEGVGCTWQLDRRGRLWLLGTSAHTREEVDVRGVTGWIGRAGSYFSTFHAPGLVRLPLPNELRAPASTLFHVVLFDRGRVMLHLRTSFLETWRARPDLELSIRPHDLRMIQPTWRDDIPRHLRFRDATVVDPDLWTSPFNALSGVRVKVPSTPQPAPWVDMAVHAPDERGALDVFPDAHSCFVLVDDRDDGRIPLETVPMTRMVTRPVTFGELFDDRTPPISAEWFSGELRMTTTRGMGWYPDGEHVLQFVDGRMISRYVEPPVPPPTRSPSVLRESFDPDGPPDAEEPPRVGPVVVSCDGERHVVTHSGGELGSIHSDADLEAELVIVALGGRMQGCGAAVHGWRTGRAGELPDALSKLRAHVFTSLRRGEVSPVLRLLDEGMDPFVRDALGRTLLHLVAHVDPNPGIEPRGRDAPPRFTATDFVRGFGRHSPITWLDATVVTPPRSAYGSRLLLPRLIELGLDINATDRRGRTPLWTAIHDGCSRALLDALVIAGADPAIASDDGSWPIDVARSQMRQDLVDALPPRSAMSTVT